ncbi:MAG: hypothetical protein AAGH15_07360, partial [Myxococcota bacterium]
MPARITACVLALLLGPLAAGCDSGSPGADGGAGDAGLVDASGDSGSLDEGVPDQGVERRDCEGSFVVRTAAELEALAGCESIEGDLTITDLPLVPSLTPLRFLETIGGSLVLRNDTALVDLSGLDALMRIGGDLDLEDVDALES